MLLDGDGEVGPALHGRVVGNDDDFAARDAADAGDKAGPRRLVVVYAVCGQRRQLEEREPGSSSRSMRSRTGSFPALDDAPVLGAASQARRVRALAELGHELLHALAIGGEHLVRRADRVSMTTNGRYHPQQSVLKPQAGQRQTACMRYLCAAPVARHLVVVAGGRAGFERRDGFDGRRARGLRHA